MTNLMMVQPGMEDNLLGGQAVFQSLLLMVMGAAKGMRRNWNGRIEIRGKGMNHMKEVQSGMMNQNIERNEIGEMKRDQEGTSPRHITGTIKNTIDIDLTDKREETFL